MELPKIARPEGGFGGMLDNVKSRLGFANADADRGYDDYGYDDGYDEYDDDFEDGFDFGDEGFDEAEYGDSYDEPYAPVTTRSTGRSYSSTPRLVTIGDVKASSSDRFARGASDTYSTGARDRVVIDTTSPAPSSPASSQGRYTSSTLGTSVRTTSRNLSVIKPMAYNDVERVARIVRSGDVAVLVLKSTPDNLFNRVLDFAFGVASALDAQVDCIGTKVFAISTGAALSESEKTSLKGQGII